MKNRIILEFDSDENALRYFNKVSVNIKGIRSVKIALEEPTDVKMVAIELRKAQKAYMSDRGNEELGKAVGAASKALDEALGAY